MAIVEKDTLGAKIEAYWGERAQSEKSYYASLPLFPVAADK